MISEADFLDVFPWMREREQRSGASTKAKAGKRVEKCCGAKWSASVTERNSRPRHVSDGSPRRLSQLPRQDQTPYLTVTSA